MITKAELLEMIDCNELDMLYLLIEKAEKAEKDAESTIKGVDAAAARVRDIMLDVKLMADVIREKIQRRRGLEKVRDHLKEAIIEEERKEHHEIEEIERRKQKRIEKLKIQIL